MAYSDALANFVLRLGSDASLLQSFKSDPRGTLNAEAGLTDDDKALLLDPDPAQIRAAISGKPLPAGVTVVVVVAVIK
ncbi:hypothetical protein [Paracoccus sp. 08]|uniref:hypothetical protein n=1 Tax=Paracoccus sp. 08 TaxID=2606624 RepID=UPI0020961C16|nr:hypothetical protein [Paracoccus sp. 08]MCO6363880.1 hypothetical protein [Paracoccus sp. 08]